MLEDLTNPKVSKHESGWMDKFLEVVGDILPDVVEEGLNELAGNNFNLFPAIGPASTPQPLTPDVDVFEWVIKEHEKRGLPPPRYEDLKTYSKQLSCTLKSIKEWVSMDEKAFWTS